MHRALKPPPAPASASQRTASTDSDDDSMDEYRSISSAEDARVRPLETPMKPRKDGSVRVAVRIRPMLPRELARNAATCVNKSKDAENAIELHDGVAERKFTFDHVFPQSTKQTELYKEALEPWMASFLQGFNVTVIAYGQTGSGKTHTMGNNMPSTSMMAKNLFARSPSSDDSSDEEGGDTLDNDEGLIPRFMHHLFTTLNERGTNHQLSVSFLEIYGEDIHDLLENPKSNRHSESLQLRENKKNGVWVQGLTEVKVSNTQEAMDQMRRGSLQRVTASTQMNERSSRSHAVYTVKIVQRVSEQNPNKDPPASNNHSNARQTAKLPTSESVGPEASETDAVIVSKLTFVDLAGSERLKKTLAEGERMKEGIQINVGLFALGNVINALGDEKRRLASHAHVPYRSSKLTRLLQDALGGNSRTLFIACVSPADSNANETLNTLQYANRAKNIQNKAVKNIDSRSAELVNLKAFNQLLCRELIKAILGEGGSVDSDNLTESCMANPKVATYLNSIQQLSVSTGLESSSDERLFETRRLVNDLTRYLQQLVPSNGHRRTSSLDSITGDNIENVQPQDDSLDFISDSGSSVVILEEQGVNSDEVLVTPYPLGKLCRTLEIMNNAFEMQEIQQVEKRQKEIFKAKVTNLETRYHRQELLRDGMADTIERMRTWLSSIEQESDLKATIDRNLAGAMEKLELVDIEMGEMQRQKAMLSSELEAETVRCQKEWKTKEAQMKLLRESPEEATINALNVLTRRTEIKVRFDGYELDSISQYLKDEEKEMAAFIDEDDAAISFMSPLFSKEELSSSQSREMLSMIQDQLRIAFDKEALEASMHQELRKRARVFQNITSGLTSCNRGEMTEREFMEKNEQDLKACEDSISQIRDAMRAKRDQRASMTEILDSIKTLDVAKDVIRRLIVEIYSHWRIYMVFDEEEDMRRRQEAEECMRQNLTTMQVDMEKNLDRLEAKYEKDVSCALEMVKSFNDAVGSGDHVHAQTESANRIVVLEAREKTLVGQLAEKDKEMESMRTELQGFQASAKSMEMKEESFRLMNRCQEIWKELGLNEEDQASKFQDINELLVKKCSQELEGLEAAREKLQARIDDAYHVITRMESVLCVADRLDIKALPTLAGTPLLEQEKYVLTQRKRLVNDLWQRISACIRSAEGIRELAADLQLTSIDDFRHVSKEEVGNFDMDYAHAVGADLEAWRHFHKNKNSADALDQLLESLGDGDSISGPSVQRYELLLNGMLKEKTRRITELEETLGAARVMARKAQLSHDDIESVINALRNGDGDEMDVSRSNVFEELCARILQTGGQLDVSKKGMESLSKVMKGLEEVEAGRSNALEFLQRTRQEAAAVVEEIAAGNEVDPETSRRCFAISLPQTPENMQDDEKFMDTLATGKGLLVGLSEPVERLLRRLFYSMNDDFAAFGIETVEQRISFFLGSKDEGQEARRAILDKYAVLSFDASENGEKECSPAYTAPQTCKDSFLSRLDPTFSEFGWVYSVSFGDQQLQKLRTSIADMEEVKRTVNSTQNRLRSLQKIMKIFNKINEFKAKIAEFETSASQKERLFGNSLRLLEEERFRKMAAKHYPNLLASLRKEVTRWLENEDGEFDLSVLGEDLKNLLLDMMNTDTGLMHLDLGTVRRPSKQNSLTPNSSSSNLQATASGSGQRVATPSRVRTQSLNNRTHTPHKV
ncbi:Kinesin-like protein KIF21B [Phytophthora citrophthora]|uniref:Kinesin-like protein KIF21B n=1 Tax=Phytophthora citrophthora TaxID=4793 RepID=A0AAD9LEU5_9STRA|nr:Kinesin-like protein KIF21B [Phytophthora citrophthora]